MRRGFFTKAAFVALGVACAHADPLDNETLNILKQEIPEAAAEFRKGQEALESDNWDEATRTFEHVRTKYPFSSLAPLAELKLADTKFQRELYEEAEDAYKNFGRLHPNHNRVDYAAFRATVCEYKAIPSDYFFLPPSIEKEQTHVKAALHSLDEFLAVYKRSTYLEEAAKMREDCRQRLAEHEMYVADFYAHRDRPRAVAGRLEGMLRDYPGVALEPEAMFKLIKAYVDIKEYDKGREVLRRMSSKYPDRPERSAAEAILKNAG
jgi:outer membrane protein assembly factor BamD